MLTNPTELSAVAESLVNKQVQFLGLYLQLDSIERMEIDKDILAVHYLATEQGKTPEFIVDSLDDKNSKENNALIVRQSGDMYFVQLQQYSNQGSAWSLCCIVTKIIMTDDESIPFLIKSTRKWNEDILEQKRMIKERESTRKIELQDALKNMQCLTENITKGL
jgi:hypothetical protein